MHKSRPLKEAVCLGEEKKEIGFAQTSVRLLDEPRKTFAALFPHHVSLSLLIYVGLTTTTQQQRLLFFNLYLFPPHYSSSQMQGKRAEQTSFIQRYAHMDLRKPNQERQKVGTQRLNFC